MNNKYETAEYDGHSDDSGSEYTSGKHTKGLTYLNERPDHRQSTSSTTDPLKSVQEGESDEHPIRAGPGETVRQLTARDESPFTKVPTAGPHEPGPETDTAVGFGWGASTLQEHETSASATSNSGTTQKSRLDATSQTDPSSIASSSDRDDDDDDDENDDHNTVHIPSWHLQLADAGYLDLANSSNRRSPLSTFPYEVDDADAAGSDMTDLSPIESSGTSSRKFGGIEPWIMTRTDNDLSITTFSPHRKATNQPIVDGEPGPEIFEFSKGLLIHMDHDKQHLHIDLFRPDDSSEDIYPEHVLAPLPLYRELRTLTIVGMKTKYQHNIWVTIWLNWRLTELCLEMENEGEAIDMEEIVSACKHARGRPTSMESALGKITASIPSRFPTVKLSLTNFTVPAGFFTFFDPAKLKEVKLHHCKLEPNFYREFEKLGFSDIKMMLDKTEALVGDFDELEIGRAY